MRLTRSTSTPGHHTVRSAALRRSLTLGTVAWMFGGVWMTATSGAPLTCFAQALRASPFQFGVLSALPFLASLLSMPASIAIERTGQRKRIFLQGLYSQRLLWIPIAGIPSWMVYHYGSAATSEAAFIFLVLTFAMHCGQGVGGPAWVSWMADVVPDRVRGKYFSRRRQWAILTSIPAALFVGWILDRRVANQPDSAALIWCSIIFCAAAVFGMVDIVFFNLIPDVPKSPQTGSHLLRAMREPLRDRPFLWFGGFVATLTFALSFMGQFVTLYVMDVVKIGNIQTQMMLLVAPMVAQLLVLPAWGIAADRMGKKPLLAIASLGMVPVGIGWCFLTPANAWLGYVLSGVGAALWAGVEVANLNLQLETSGSTDEAGQVSSGGSSYAAVNGVIVNIAGLAGGLAAGVIAQALRDWHWKPAGEFKVIRFYDVLFIGSAVLRLLAVVIFLPRLHEPEARPSREVLRFMTTNIYNNVYGAVFQSLRTVRLVSPRNTSGSQGCAATVRLSLSSSPGVFSSDKQKKCA